MGRMSQSKIQVVEIHNGYQVLFYHNLPMIAMNLIQSKRFQIHEKMDSCNNYEFLMFLFQIYCDMVLIPMLYNFFRIMNEINNLYNLFLKAYLIMIHHKFLSFRFQLMYLNLDYPSRAGHCHYHIQQLIWIQGIFWRLIKNLYLRLRLLWKCMFMIC